VSTTKAFTINNKSIDNHRQKHSQSSAKSNHQQRANIIVKRIHNHQQRAIISKSKHHRQTHSQSSAKSKHHHVPLLSVRGAMNVLVICSLLKTTTKFSRYP
jgi:hypothetical protein